MPTNETLPPASDSAGQGRDESQSPQDLTVVRGGRTLGGRVKTVRDLGLILGCGKSKAARVAKEPWLAALRGPDGGWDEDEVRRVFEHRNRDAGLTVQKVEEEVLAASDDPVALARVGMRVAARRLARPDPKTSSSKLLEDLTESLGGLRKTEAGYLEMAQRRGALIERDVAKACMAAVTRRFVLACERLEVRIASQMELWLVDPGLRALSPGERVKVVREWVRVQTKQARLGETEAEARAEIERLVANEIADRKRS